MTVTDMTVTDMTVTDTVLSRKAGIRASAAKECEKAGMVRPP
jgi:hypothetical protein